MLLACGKRRFLHIINAKHTVHVSTLAWYEVKISWPDLSTVQQSVHSLSLTRTNAADGTSEGGCELGELQGGGDGYLKHGYQHLRRLQHQATAGFLI